MFALNHTAREEATDGSHLKLYRSQTFKTSLLAEIHPSVKRIFKTGPVIHVLEMPTSLLD